MVGNGIPWLLGPYRELLAVAFEVFRSLQQGRDLLLIRKITSPVRIGGPRTRTTFLLDRELIIARFAKASNHFDRPKVEYGADHVLASGAKL